MGDVHIPRIRIGGIEGSASTAEMILGSRRHDIVQKSRLSSQDVLDHVLWDTHLLRLYGQVIIYVKGRCSVHGIPRST